MIERIYKTTMNTCYGTIIIIPLVDRDVNGMVIP